MGHEPFHSLSRILARLLPDRLCPAWLTRHSDRCPICLATRTRQSRLDALLHQAAREEAGDRETAAGLDPFIQRLWARIDREAVSAPRETRLRPARLALGFATLTPVVFAVVWWLGAPSRHAPYSALARRPNLAQGQPRLMLQPSGEPLVLSSSKAGGANAKPAHAVRPAVNDRQASLARRLKPAPVEGPVRGSQPRSRGLPRDRPVVHGRETRRTGDLAYLNTAPPPHRRHRANLAAPDWEALEARLRRAIQVSDDFVQIPFPRLAAASDRQLVAATEAYQREAAVVDARLAREVTVRAKAIALADLCEQLRADTGIQLVAGNSVADEKVTVFCEKMPLRDLMRQLGRPFGYAWLRSRQTSEKPTSEPNTEHRTPNTEYRYELAQDLKSQLLEEELRNRDQNAALLDMEEGAKRYRSYLDLSPEEALARAATAPPGEKEILKHCAGKGWGPAQLYSRLTPADMAALRAGQTLTFSASPLPGEQSLPPELARNVIASLRDYRVERRGDGYEAGPVSFIPDGQPVTAFPEAQPIVSLRLIRSELGQVSLSGWSGFFIGTPPHTKIQLMGDGERNIANGISPAVRNPRNAVLNAALADDPELRPRLSVRPSTAPSLREGREPGSVENAKTSDLLSPPSSSGTGEPRVGREADRGYPRSGSWGRAPGAGGGVRSCTTADVLEALHRATGMSIVSDYYTRLFRPEEVSVLNQSRFEALNHLADAMRMRWRKDGKWLQFRTTSYFNDRLKEVPNRLLNRWAAARRRNGALTVEELVEIAQLSDAQLDSKTMAEGARLLYGLTEWELAGARDHWLYLAGFTPEQRRTAQSAAGLPFRQMSLAQQQRFLSLALDSSSVRLDSLAELAEGGLQVAYLPPVGFQLQYPQTGNAFERGLDAPRARGQTREAALEAARRIDPNVTPAQIVPAEMSVTFTYRLGGPNARFTPMIVHLDTHNFVRRRSEPVQANR